MSCQTGGRITSRVGEIRDCPVCHLPCHVVDGRYPKHDCTGKDD